jgi:hypothetical protein
MLKIVVSFHRGEKASNARLAPPLRVLISQQRPSASDGIGFNSLNKNLVCFYPEQIGTTF